MDADGLRPNVIIVDARKDKKLSMLKQLAATLVKGLNPNPAAIIKKIAGLVCISLSSFFFSIIIIINIIILFHLRWFLKIWLFN